MDYRSLHNSFASPNFYYHFSYENSNSFVAKSRKNNSDEHMLLCSELNCSTIWIFSSFGLFYIKLLWIFLLLFVICFVFNKDSMFWCKHLESLRKKLHTFCRNKVLQSEDFLMTWILSMKSSLFLFVFIFVLSYSQNFFKKTRQKWKFSFLVTSKFVLMLRKS